MRRILWFSLVTALSSLFLILSLISNGQQITTPNAERTWQEMMQDPNTSFFETRAKFNEYWQGREITRGSGYKAFKRWEWFMESRVSSTGAWPAPDAVFQAMQQQPEMFQENNFLPGNWSYIGNTSVPTGGGGAGRINGLRELPGSTTTFFACSPGGGLWKTTNSGTSWSMLGTDFLGAIGTSDVAIDPTNTQVMYLATGDCDAGDTYALGVLKSTDGGTTWNTTGLSWAVTQTRSTARIIINPTNTQIVICATSDGIYRTTNGGTSWTRVQTGSFKDLRMKPGDATTWYASSNQFYKSTNSGLTWTLITSGLPSSATSQRMSIATSVATSTVAYALVSGTDSGLLGVYKSIDSGTTFTQMTGSNPNYLNWSSTPSATVGGQGWYDLRIEADPANADIIYIGGVNLWKSINGGTSWTIAGHWTGSGAPYVHADIHDIHFIAGTTRMLVGCDGGVFSTTNGGPNFSDISNNLQIAQQYRLSVAGTNSNLVISGWQDNGTNLKNNAVHTRPMGGDGMDCQINPSNSTNMFGTIQNGIVQRSTNSGVSFSTIVSNGGTGINEDGAWVTPIILGPTPTHVFVGKSVVYKSTNNGTSFVASAAFGTGLCNDLAIAPSNSNILYASKGSSLFKSIDNAATFTLVTGTQGYSIKDIAIHNTDPNKVWLAVSNYAAGNKVYFTSNGGTTWTNISGSLPNLPANALAFQPGTNDGIYVGMDAGVYYRDNVLGNFVPYINDLPNVNITDLDVHTGTSTLTAATFGRGLWRAPLYSLPNLDAAITNVNSPTGSYCSTTVSPQVTILNAGTNPIISMTIEYQVTGQSMLTYNWTGNLLTGVSANITLPNLNYGTGSFTFNVNITAVNTLTDDNTANNSAITNYYCINGINNATLTLRTDCWPNETSWNITDASSNVMFSGSGYGSETTNLIPLCLPDGCFTLNVFDSYGDGLSNGSCSQGNGNYFIKDDATTTTLVIMGAANFGTSVSHNFCYPLAVVPGCMNNTACNYNPLATVDNGSCTYGPANDVCSGATLLIVDNPQTASTNVTSCIEGANPNCGGGTQIKDIWFKFVYNGGKISITTNFAGGMSDTRLALYGSCGGAIIACNDDISASNYKSLISPACGVLSIGQTYYIQAGGYNGTTGTFNIQITSAPEICNAVDDDCDSLIDEGFDIDGDGFTSCGGDCNDNNNAVYPGATEVCNLIDDNCDSVIDEGVQLTFYRDLDNDGYGNLAVSTLACTAPVGYVANSTDCNDNSASIHPGAAEVCNGVDDNCNASIDDGVLITFYRDFDNDGYGNIALTTQACSAPVGYVSNSTDCNDSNSAIRPGATEVCNGVDDNCNTLIDEGVLVTFYRDFDNDGYGDINTTSQACSAPGGYVANNTDCNDNNAAIRPNATEACNGIDDNCNGSTDEGVLITFYRDQDNDGYGFVSITTLACSAPVGYVANSTDCNDSNAAVHPGATETCNGTDDNCNTTIDEGVLITFYRDLDNDGFGNLAVTVQACSAPVGFVANSTDCDDNDNNIFPGAPEACNGIDDNCDTFIDNGVTFQNYYTDADNDGYGAGLIGNFCAPPASSSLNNLDCNDANANINPAVSELCNGADDNCNGSTDEGVLVTFYRDFDNDGYGNLSIATQACTAPVGYVSNSTDCNDSNAAIRPGATELCNGIDDDCDGLTDNGITFQNYYTDLDNDGYGSTLMGSFCTAPANASLSTGDCNDGNSAVHPGVTEICNAIDDNCNALIDETFDVDSDGYTTCTGDCNDNNASVFPGANETCNGVDDNCNGSIDEGTTLLNWYVDADSDSFGSYSATPVLACAQPAGYSPNNGDCNDNNPLVKPLTTEICANGIDDNCNGFIDENCTTGTAQNDNMVTAQTIYQSGNIYPSCYTLNGTCVGATPSPESNPANVITGEDVWYRFTAPAPGLRVVFNSASFNGVLELRNAAAVQLDVENMTLLGGTEMMNYTGLTVGQNYYIAVRNHNSGQGNGTFTLCVQALMASSNDYPSGTYPSCNNIKANWTGADMYVFNFTPQLGGAATSATSSAYISLGYPTLGLLLGTTYINTVDAVYQLTNGAGTPEQIIVTGYVTSLVTIASQPDVQVKSNQRCPATLLRSGFVSGSPTICGAVNYEFEFTETTSVGVPIGSPFSVMTPTAFPFRTLSFTTPVALINGSYYSVRIRPHFAASVGTYGTPQCIRIAAPTSAPPMRPSMDEEVEEGDILLVDLSEADEFVSIYPNPGDGDMIQLSIVSQNATIVGFKLIDPLGKIVENRQFNSSGTLNELIHFSQRLTSGLYMVEVILNNKIITRRLIIH